jgi:hypothetical protein
MRNLGSREKILGGVLVVVALVAGWRLLLSPDSSLLGGRSAPPRTADLGAAQNLIQALPEITLHPSLEVGYTHKRNIFDYSKCRAEIEAEKRRAQAIINRQKLERTRREKADEERLKRQAEIQQRESQPRAPVAPNPQFTYIGNLGEVKDRIAVFVSKGREGEVSLAKVGEVVEEDFVVKEIEFDRVILGYTRPEFQDSKPKTLPVEGSQS